MTILLEPIKAEFGATDTQMGLLTDLAFALFYATLGVPMARLAEAYGWRNVFWIFGLPGVALAVLIGATAREPVRAKQMALDYSSPWVAIRRIIALPGFVAIGLAVG